MEKWFLLGTKKNSFFDDVVDGLLSTSLKVGKAGDIERETLSLYKEARQAFEASPLSKLDEEDFSTDLVIEARRRAGQRLPHIILFALCETTEDLMREDALLSITVDWSKVELKSDVGFTIRRYLRLQKHFFENYEYHIATWVEKLFYIYSGMLGYVPEYMGTEAREDPGASSFSVPLIDLMREPAEVIERLIVTLFDDDVVNAGLFEEVRRRFDKNLLLASGLDPESRDVAPHRLTLPTKNRGLSPEQLVETYLRGTTFADFLTTRVPYVIEDSVRFEHMHIVGGTGHGKTQLLQYFIAEDLERALEEQRSIIVIDGQGDLIRKIAKLDYFNPQADPSLAERFVLIDPTDIEYPAALNMFDANLDRIADYPLLEQEKILNGTVELYEYLFGAILGAELTQKQDVLFRYLARLMLVIPDATIHTLMGLMEDPRRYLHHVEELGGTAQVFFEREFLDKSFAGTRRQISRRIWGVLSTPAFERMFSHPRNKVDLFDAMNSGKIILINTAKDLLKQQGCEIFGRFFVAMIAQAAMQRSVVPEDERIPCHVYVDEAHDYFDDSIEHILNQARKYKVAIHLAHQNLDQLSSKLKASIMASTSIKLAGGVSSKDGHDFAREMRCDASFIQAMHKGKESTEFACWIKNATPQAVRLAVPLGHMESLETIDSSAYEELLAANRTRYCSTLEEVEASMDQLRAAPSGPLEAPPPSSGRPEKASPSQEFPGPPGAADANLEPHKSTSQELQTPVPENLSEPQPVAAPLVSKESHEPALPGRGGRQHKYLQQFVKKLGDERNFRSTIEESLLGGASRVDVSLQTEQRRIAVEISITTSPEHERENILKCLDAGFDEVVVLCAEAKHQRTLRGALAREFAGEQPAPVHFFVPEDLIAHLDHIAAEAASSEEMIRGYRVKVTHKAIGEDDAKTRRQAIAKVVMRSLGSMKDEN